MKPLLSIFLLVASTTQAYFISSCPHIPPHAPPLNVHDLRADDIKVIAAMGDSVTAGMVAKNLDKEYMTPNDFIEYRGVSWVMGGDDGASSLANYFKHFQPGLYGSSLGQRKARLCPSTFFCLDSRHEPSIDVLNAAQSGATSKELPEQVEYLSSRIGLSTIYAKTWKLINVFIGFNDASVSCVPGNNVKEYKTNVKTSLEQLVKNVDYAFINLVGIMHYNDLIHITDKIPGYKKKFSSNFTINLLDYECYCCGRPGGQLIGEFVKEYNQALSEIANELSGSVLGDLFGSFLLGKHKKNITVVYQPINPIIDTVPPTALSNMDGYHPNTFGYQYLSRALWNQMYLPQDKKLRIDVFDASRPLFCPGMNDRLQTNKRLL